MTTGSGQHPRWILVDLIREAARNVLTFRGRSLVLILFAVLAGSTGTGLEVARSHALVTELRQLRDSGRNILNVRSVDKDNTEFAVDRRSCEALNDEPSVLRAGIVARLGSAQSEEYGPLVPVLGVSAQLLPDVTGGGVVVGVALGESKTRRLATVEGAVRSIVAGVAQPNGIDLNSAFSILAPADVAWADNCVVELDQFASASLVAPSLVSRLTTRGGSPLISQGINLPYDPPHRFAVDPAQRLNVGLAALGALLALVKLVGTKGEVAAYRLSGTTRSDFAILQALEQHYIAAIYLASASLSVLALESTLVDPVGVLYRAVLGWTVWLTVFNVGSLVMLRRDVSSLAKDH